MPVWLIDVSTSQWADWWGEIKLNQIYSWINLPLCLTHRRDECRKQMLWAVWCVSKLSVHLNCFTIGELKHGCMEITPRFSLKTNDWTLFMSEFIWWSMILWGWGTRGETTSSDWIKFLLQKRSMWTATKIHFRNYVCVCVFQQCQWDEEVSLGNSSTCWIVFPDLWQRHCLYDKKMKYKPCDVTAQIVLAWYTP